MPYTGCGQESGRSQGLLEHKHEQVPANVRTIQDGREGAFQGRVEVALAGILYEKPD